MVSEENEDQSLSNITEPAWQWLITYRSRQKTPQAVKQMMDACTTACVFKRFMYSGNPQIQDW